MATSILSPQPRQQFINAGIPVAGGKLFTYAAGTTTKATTYTDSTSATPNTNPVVLDSQGRADVWLTATTAYKFVLSPSTDGDPPTNAIWTVDNITGLQSAAIWPGLPVAAAGGTVDAITATFTPAIALADLQACAVVSTGANTLTNPTFAPNALAAKTMTARGGAALVAGDTGAAGFVMILEYNLANTRWELLNPAKVRAASDLVGIAPTANGGTGIAFFTAAGPTAARIYTFPDAAATILTTNAAVTVAQGGTGRATLGANGVVIGEGTGGVNVTGAGTAAQVLTSNGPGVDPTFQAAAAGSAGANPTATIGTAAVNGVATTFLRSDGAPAFGNLTGPVTSVGMATTIAAASVAQGQLKTTIGTMTSAIVSSFITGPGGEYGFWPTSKSTSFTTSGHLVTSISSMDATNTTPLGIGTALTTSLVQYFHLGTGGTDTITVQQRYVQASPPYDLGDGEILLFIFALVDSLGKVIATYTAPDPPWANNGPTNIHSDFIDAQGRAWQTRKPKANMVALKTPSLRDAELARLVVPQTIEVTQALKQADMPLIPHPFQGNDMIGKTVVLLDPVSALIGTLAGLHANGESLGELLHDKYILLDNVPLPRKSPPGVSAFTAKWKITP